MPDEDDHHEDEEAPTMLASHARLMATAPWPPFGAGGPRRCSFCSRREDSVRHLVRSRDADICDRCVQLAAEAIAAAPPNDKAVRIRVRPPAPKNRDVVEEEIERVFETAIGGDATDDERLELIEGSSNLRPALREVRERLPRAERADTFVEHVRFLTEDEVEVHFVLVYPGGISAPRFPQTGHAVLSDGRWKVARETWCRLVGQIGVQCPPAE